MDQKYCVGYPVFGVKQDAGKEVERGYNEISSSPPSPTAKEEKDVLCLLIICNLLFFGFVNTLPH